MRFLALAARATLLALAVVTLVSLLAGPAWADDLVATLQTVPWLGPWIPDILLAGAVCALVATRLPAPTPASPTWWVVTYRVINWIALNVGHAKNADDAAAAKRAESSAASRTGLQVAFVAMLPLFLLLSACQNGQLTPAGQVAVGAGTQAAVTLAGIAAQQNTTVASVVAGGQLFCRGSEGVVALLKGTQQPTSVIGRSADVVAQACAAIGAIPVPPPANPGAVPVATAPATGL